MILLYDGTFEGFLTLVYDVYYEKLHVTQIIKRLPTTLLFERFFEIFTDEVKTNKVLQALKKQFSHEQQRTIFHIMLCDTRDFEMALLSYIQIGFKNPHELKNITHHHLFYIHTLEKELLSLVHKMYGFTRFEELEDNSLYARVETKFNIIPFLGEHFKKRLGDIPFIIHDTKRSLAYIKHHNQCDIRSIASYEQPNYSSCEEHFKALWKTFFKAASVDERHNLKRQQHWVPLLYRTYMSEFSS